MVEETEDGGVPYTFAVEYDGPPLPYELPRAVPINVDKIPVAAVVSHRLSGGEKLSSSSTLPVVKPLFPPPAKPLPIARSEPPETESATVTTVSPTSVIERATSDDNGMSGELSSSGPLVDSSRARSSGSTLDPGSSSRIRVSNELSRDDWASNASVLSADYYPSSRVSSLKEASHREDFSCSEVDVGRGHVVTFRGVKSDDGDGGGGSGGVVDSGEFGGEECVGFSRREPLSKGKKGACYRCFKGNRFTEKEVCIVCDAKYCSNCVLRAMGSMPEGRKCVTCIGYPIDEGKRGNLGKCSKVLKRLLNDLEVRQIMKAEKLCEANQLPSEYVCVNGEPLCHEELVILQSCPNPPKKLKPGNYWYDKVSGFWGKEGQKPSQIISHHLNVGGPIKADASNGNTKVFINGREITKVELRMLQLAGVQCAGNPHFWVNEDGSYLEEGQKNPKGYIWGKAGIKLVCAFLSLPVPSKTSVSYEEESGNVVSRSLPDYFEQRTPIKILLAGYSGSGTSTIFKQAKILYKSIPFTEEERESIKLTIQSNVYAYLGILLEGRDRFEEECLGEVKDVKSLEEIETTGRTDERNHKNIYAIGPRLKVFSDWLLRTMVSGNLEAVFPAASREYAPLVEELWKDPAIQATYQRRCELEMLPIVASYFLERAVDILSIDYDPSDLDILYAEGVTSSNGLACLDFSYPRSASDDKYDSEDQHESLLRYQLIRVQARGCGENCKWLEMFEHVGMVIFCVSLNDYDQFTLDGCGSYTNKMMLSRKFFESVVMHPTFDQTDFLLLLNKYDLFEEKMEHVPLTQCDWFDDFHPVISHNRSNRNSNSINHNPTLGQLGFHYIAVKFKRLYSSITGRKLYVSMVKGLEPGSVDAALKYAREIMKWGEEMPNFSTADYSMYSTEASFYSP